MNRPWQDMAPFAVSNISVIQKDPAMDGKAKRHSVVSHLFGAIVRDIANPNTLSSATREIDDVVPDPEADDPPAVLQPVDKVSIDGNNRRQNRVRVLCCADG